MKLEEIDRSDLIREAYRIDGISEPECRSIFVDWALKLPADIPPAKAITMLLDIYGEDEHPMTQVLTEGLAPAAPGGRRGGRNARRS